MAPYALEYIGSDTEDENWTDLQQEGHIHNEGAHVTEDKPDDAIGHC